MADTFVQLSPDSSGKKMDTRTESTNSEHRQVMVIGDPANNAGVAPVDVTKGLAVDLTASGSNTNALKVDGSAVTQPVSLATNQPTLQASSAKIGVVTTDQTTHGTSDLVAADITKIGGTAQGVTNPLFTADGSPTSSTATWTSATSINTALTSSNTQGYSTATVTTVETGTTTTAGALTFEVYDGTNWWAISGQQINSYTLNSTYTLVNGTSVAWTFDIAGFQGFRTRLSTAITGTGSPQVVIIQQLQATENTIAPTVGVGQQLDSTNDSISAWIKGCTYTKVSASGVVVTGTCLFYGYTVEASNTGTAQFFDNTAGSGNTVGGTGTAVTLTAGTNVFFTHPMIMTTGLYFLLAGTSATVNVLTRSISK